jgi:chromosomal replication initiation ATPase DnaA
MASADELAPRIAGVLSGPASRPLALLGRSGSGKTALLRGVTARSGREVVWGSARDLVERMREAIRDDRYPGYRATFAGDERPRCVEHVEDLRGKPATRGEVQKLLEDRAARGHCTVLTMTRTRGDAEVVEWLASWAELVVVG